jgi:hypothetical protein
MNDEERSGLLDDIANGEALYGDYRKSQKLLEHLHPDSRRPILTSIAIAKVVARDLEVEEAFTSLSGERELDALVTLAERLPESRRVEARTALRRAMAISEKVELEYPQSSLREYASLQAELGFFDDARATARRITDKDELLAAYAMIGIAQAHGGRSADTRETFIEAEQQARKFGFDAEDHANLAASLAEAGLLQESYDQVLALKQREKTEYFFDQSLDPVIRAHLAAGKARRAYEVAALMSERQDGNPHYFLTILSETRPD